MEKKLTRVKDGKIFMGVCSGIAKAYGKDPMIVRGLFILLTLFVGLGPIAYLILGFVLPEED